MPTLKVIHNTKAYAYEVKNVNLFDALISHGVFLPSDCGGNGKCGKCKVKVLEGSFKNVSADNDGCVLACEADIIGDATIEVADAVLADKAYYSPDFSGEASAQVASCVGDCSHCKANCKAYDIALDLGTTTLVASLLDAKDGSQIAWTNSLNPQIIYGADVLSRIDACSKGQLEKLHGLIISKINQMIVDLTFDKGDCHVGKLVVAGNTTMLHILAGVSPISMGEAPFEPEFVDTQRFFGSNIGLNAYEVVLMPVASAFVGADIVGGVYALNLNQSDKINLLVDLGTNGEMVLSNHTVMDATSTAAGPALEGAAIACGMGGVDGAICSFEIVDGKRKYSVLGDVKTPKGICGAGLIDVIAEMLKHKVIDSHGTFQKSDIDYYVKNDAFFVSDDLYVSIKDVREFQLAKSAVLTGIEILLRRSGVGYADVDNVYIAGGLGQNINLNNAIAVGLLPKQLEGKYSVVGNSALAGAICAARSEVALHSIEQTATEIEAFSLAGDYDFGKTFIHNIDF